MKTEKHKPRTLKEFFALVDRVMRTGVSFRCAYNAVRDLVSHGGTIVVSKENTRIEVLKVSNGLWDKIRKISSPKRKYAAMMKR